MDVDVHVRRGVGVAERAGIAAGDHRPLPPLRVAEEELRDRRPAGNRVVQRVIGVEVPANTHHALSLAGYDNGASLARGSVRQQTAS